jgi:chromosome segregation ATPase
VVRAKQAEESVRQHQAHLEVVEEERAEERAAAKVVVQRAAKAHAMALKRGRDARAEVKALQLEVSTKDTRLDALALELAQREVAALQRQAEADARLNDLCARLHAGDQRARQMRQEVEGLKQQLEADAKDATSKHAVVEEQLRSELRGSQVALAAYQNFQAKEGGAYKDCVRLCYYSLIDKKVSAHSTLAHLALLCACTTRYRPLASPRAMQCGGVVVAVVAKRSVRRMSA